MTIQTFDDAHTFMPESDGEVARQLLLHHKLSGYMGGPLPPSLDLSAVRDVLDVACGAGAWVNEVASLYPSMNVVGIDRSAYFIEQAQASAGDKGKSMFKVADMRVLEEYFSPASFDLIHLRFLAGEMLFQHFPALIASLVRLCRADGLIVWTEADLPQTNSNACAILESTLLYALIKAERAFWQGYSLRLGFDGWIETWLQQEGCTVVLDKITEIDVSAGTSAHTMFTHQMWVCGHQVRSFCLNTKTLTANEYEQIFAQMQHELREETFRGSCLLRTIVARK